MTTNGFMEKDFVFKSDASGTKNGRNWRSIELHDPITLDNTRFFVQEGQNVSTAGINFKDKVKASLFMDIRFGKPELVLAEVKKI